MQRYNIDIDQSVLDDLNGRIAGTRWTDEIDNEKWEYGTNKKYLQELCGYWKDVFDWKGQEHYLNSFHHYKTNIDNTGIHFIHEKCRGTGSVTNTINAAFRLYNETMKAMMQAMYNPLTKLNPFDKTGSRSEVPAAFAIFPKDISSPPQEFAERFFNVQQWTEMPAGGHFAAMEEPALLAGNIREFAESMVNMAT